MHMFTKLHGPSMLETTIINRETGRKIKEFIYVTEYNENMRAMNEMNMGYNHLSQKSSEFLLNLFESKVDGKSLTHFFLLSFNFFQKPIDKQTNKQHNWRRYPPAWAFKHFWIRSGIESIKLRHNCWSALLYPCSSRCFVYIGLAHSFIPRVDQSISTGFKFELFGTHSSMFNFIFAIFPLTNFDVYHSARSCWNIYGIVFGNRAIDFFSIHFVFQACARYLCLLVVHIHVTVIHHQLTKRLFDSSVLKRRKLVRR